MPGDVGLVTAFSSVAFGTFGAVRTSAGRWAVKANDGLSVADFDAVSAWRAEQPVDPAALTEFLRSAFAEPFRYGAWDCALTPANWILRLTGRDPAAALRGRYDTALGWRRIAARAGGLTALFAQLAGDAGLAQVA